MSSKPTNEVRGVLEQFYKKLPPLQLTSDKDRVWNIRPQELEELISSLLSQELELIKEEIAYKTVDLCENSQEFRTDVLALLQSRLDKYK